MSNLVEHAKREMQLVGLDKPDADYDGMIYKAVLELVEVFSKQGHSGFSAGYVRELFSKLSAFKELSPIGTTEDEWVNVSGPLGTPMWQNKRNYAYFSTDNGKTWYDVDDKSKIFKKQPNDTREN